MGSELSLVSQWDDTLGAQPTSRGLGRGATCVHMLSRLGVRIRVNARGRTQPHNKTEQQEHNTLATKLNAPRMYIKIFKKGEKERNHACADAGGGGRPINRSGANLTWQGARSHPVETRFRFGFTAMHDYYAAAR